MIWNLFATDIIFKLDIPNALKERFIEYWSNRGEKKFNVTYSMELPYLQYIHSKNWYKNFFSSAPTITKIEVLNKKQCTKKSCLLWMALYKQNYQEPIYLYDKWLKINGMWYHKYDDSILPIFTGKE